MWHYQAVTQDDLRAAIKKYDATLKAARKERDATIARAAAEGMRQVDIINATDYSRETIRRIVDAAKEIS